MNSIFWKGVPSTTIPSLLICELPPISKPRMRTKETVIDGRDGSIIEELGYESYTKTIVIGLRSDFDINEVIKYFTGEGDLVFSNEIDKVYKARIIEGIDFERLLRFKRASVKFLCQPFKYKRDEVFKETEVATASGTSIVVGDIANEKLACFSIYGKTTQARTPSPTESIGIVSLCVDKEIVVTVNNETVDLNVADAFRGLVVTDKSLATYTDASGQMWCADEIDIKKGVHVERIYRKTIDANTVIKKHSHSNADYFVCYVEDEAKSGSKNCLSTHFPFTASDGLLKTSSCVYCMKGVKSPIHFSVPTTIANDVETFKTWAVANKVIVCYIRETPIETPLTDEQIAMLNSLDLSKPSTITNDENAFMKIGYFKPFEVFNEGIESSRPLMVLKGSGTVEISVNGTGIFTYTFPEGENEVVIDSEKEDAYLGSVLKNRNMNGEFPILLPKTNIIGWSGDVESIEILPRSRWL